MTSAVVVPNAVPPVAAAYHFIAVPVAVKLATVADDPAQKICEAVPVGAAGAAGWAFITILADAVEIHNEAFVTV